MELTSIFLLGSLKARCAESMCLNVINPKPRDFPVPLSVMTAPSSISPNCSKACSESKLNEMIEKVKEHTHETVFWWVRQRSQSHVRPPYKLKWSREFYKKTTGQGYTTHAHRCSDWMYQPALHTCYSRTLTAHILRGNCPQVPVWRSYCQLKPSSHLAKFRPTCEVLSCKWMKKPHW